VRVVLDTNVLISALLWRGAAHRLLQAAREGKLSLVSSPALLQELSEVLARPKFVAILSKAGVSHAAVMQAVYALIELVDAPPLAMPVCRDPDDDTVLAVALAAQLDWIVSGDEDLKVLHPFEGIAILSPAQALEQLQLLQ
jgi:uncharacterized protein